MEKRKQSASSVTLLPHSERCSNGNNHQRDGVHTPQSLCTGDRAEGDAHVYEDVANLTVSRPVKWDTCNSYTSLHSAGTPSPVCAPWTAGPGLRARADRGSLGAPGAGMVGSGAGPVGAGPGPGLRGADGDRPGIPPPATPDPKTTKLFKTAHEIFTTEEEYVKRLYILTKIKEQVSQRVIKCGVGGFHGVSSISSVSSVFRDLDAIYRLHRVHLLPPLGARIETWTAESRVGDLMKRVAPYFKMYTEYLQGFQAARRVIISWHGRKDDPFVINMREYTDDPVLQMMELHFLLTEPIQRIPRYRILLLEYLKHLPSDSNDFADATEALNLISDVANHFETMMEAYSLGGRILELQRKLEPDIELLESSRHLVKEGRVHVINPRTNKATEHVCLLFNNLFLLCLDKHKYIIQHNFDLRNSKMVASGQLSEGFHMCGGKQSVLMHFRTYEMKTAWEKELIKLLDQRTRDISKSGSFRSCRSSAGSVCSDVISHRQLGKMAPPFQNFLPHGKCSMCAETFHILRRKQHCAACGQVVCSVCCNHKRHLAYGVDGRVCHCCYAILTDEDKETAGELSWTKADVRKTCGTTLEVSDDAGKSWQRRYCCLLSNHRFYTVTPTQAMLFPLYRVVLEAEIPQSPGSKTRPSVVLRGPSKSLVVCIQASKGSNGNEGAYSLLDGWPNWALALEDAIKKQLPPLVTNSRSSRSSSVSGSSSVFYVNPSSPVSDEGWETDHSSLSGSEDDETERTPIVKMERRTSTKGRTSSGHRFSKESRNSYRRSKDISSTTHRVSAESNRTKKEAASGDISLSKTNTDTPTSNKDKMVRVRKCINTSAVAETKIPDVEERSICTQYPGETGKKHGGNKIWRKSSTPTFQVKFGKGARRSTTGDIKRHANVRDLVSKFEAGAGNN